MNLIGEKQVKLQDAKYKLSENSNNETSIFIDKELAENIGIKDDSILNFTLKKSNIIEALDYTYKFSEQLFTKDKLPGFDKKWYQKELALINEHFNKTDEYKCRVSLGTGNRYYLKELRQSSGFNIRDLLIQDHYILKFHSDNTARIFVQIIPIERDYEQPSKVIYENSSLRPFAFEVFKRIYSVFGDEFLKSHVEEQNTRIGGFEYVGMKFPEYFGNSKLLGIFDKEKAKAVLESGSRFRYQKEPLKLYSEDPVFYFSTEFEYNRSNDSHILFEDYKRFIKEYSENSYSITRDERGIYQLMVKSENSKTKKLLFKEKSLREFAFQTFKITYKAIGEDFLDKYKKYSTRKHGSTDIEAVTFPKYFGNKKILAVFNDPQTKVSLKTGNSIRFKPENLNILGHKNIYFSSQWSHPNDPTHPNFNELVRFIDDYGQGQFEIEFDSEKKMYNLYKLDIKNFKKDMLPIQKIFFGPPGSGKSHHIKSKYQGSWPRVTFHPELDYQGFIGAYKPTVVDDKITYKFIEEAFLRAYCNAWNSDQPYYLIIEEINRGNCAQIFGDIFQLLDRDKDGYSVYPIICSPDIMEHLSKKLGGIDRLEEYKKVTECEDFSRMSMPNNFNILCTMNTSDQSLFPMDSAFKRRWDWQYIPIDYKDANTFIIKIDNEKEYNWGTFIKEINGKIKDHTQSEDKQIGNRFLTSSTSIISADQFVSKVVFYLWSEIYKDEYNTGNSIFFSDINTEITFSDFFVDDKINLELTAKFIDFNLPITDNRAQNSYLTELEGNDEGEIIENE